jgi:LmbE family N-acetylglucosaminyl deacetylase
MADRRTEDQHALRVVGAHGDYGSLLDRQYEHDHQGRSHNIREYLGRVLERYPDHRVLAPLGLLHPDHIEVREQALSLYSSLEGERNWTLYTDLPYGAHRPFRVRSAEHEILAKGFELGEREIIRSINSNKIRALEAYKSQLPLVLHRRVFRFSRIRTERYRALSLQRDR